ncbi:hypothetical protein K457DRAFT_133994 [Linnemannia elongata AG-77]|uniref:Uncharacterized protein n=1 Tax=Linnemannia elongata AG-77 TaxID=1314771 RepID=A0A197KAB5_9FUNG|nr:hypothetical protein K457DRAFT_133994 [Linnemannia elongata AG-77]
MEYKQFLQIHQYQLAGIPENLWEVISLYPFHPNTCTFVLGFGGICLLGATSSFSHA